MTVGRRVPASGPSARKPHTRSLAAADGASDEAGEA